MLWLVMKLVKDPQINELHAMGFTAIILSDKHHGYLPIYSTYEAAVADFPYEHIVSLKDDA